MKTGNIPPVIGGVGYLSLALATMVQADCTLLHQQATRAIATQDLQQLQSAYEQAARAPDCDDTFRQVLRGHVADAYTTAAQAAMQQQRTEQARALLLQAVQYENVWQARALLGDLAHQHKDFGKAAAAYQEALDLIQEVKASPSLAIIQALYRKAEASRLLASEHVPMPRHRATGQFAGVGAMTFRSFQPVARIVPITFHFDSTDLDSKGKEAAAELARFLQAWRPTAITLIGHTDPVGSDTYNEKLSRERAEALKRLLQETYPGQIRTAGKGEKEPYQPMDEQTYSQEELHRLHRRVELLLE